MPRVCGKRALALLPGLSVRLLVPPMPPQAAAHRHGAALFRHHLWRFYARRAGCPPPHASTRASLAPQVHRTPSQHPIHPYEAGEDLLRPLPPATTPFAAAVGQLVDTEEPLRISDTLLEQPAIDRPPVDPPLPDLTPDRHAGPFF